MARDIPTIDRQILTPTSPITPNRSFEKMGQATAELGDLITNKLADQAVYQSGVAGSLDALENNAPKNLAMPLTRATAAYNKAVIDTETRALTVQARDMMMEAYTKASNPATFNRDTPAVFNAEVTGIMQGILESARNENRAVLRDELNQMASNTKIRILDHAIQYDNKQTEVLFKRELDQAQRILNESIVTKDSEGRRQAEVLLEKIYSDYSTISEPIKTQIPDIKRGIEDKVKISEVVADYVEAYSRNMEGEFLNNLAKTKPAGLTEEQYIQAQGEVLKLNTKNKQLVNEAQTQTYNQGIFEINQGRYPTIESLDEAYAARLPAVDMWQLRTAWTKANREIFKAQNNFLKVEEARKKGPQEVAKTSAQERNDHYAVKQQMILDQANNNATPDSPPVTQLSLTEKMQFIVAPSGAPVPDYNTELAYALKTNYTTKDENGKDVIDPFRSLDALNAYRFAWENRDIYGDVLKGLDPEADDIAQYVLSINAKTEVNDFELLEQARNNVKDKSDPTRVVRKERLDTFYKLYNGVDQMSTYYKDTFGINPSLGGVDAHFGNFRTLFDHYFMGTANGDEGVALKMATAQMRDWGTSRFGDKDDIMYTPPEKSVSFSDMGFWLDNQMLLALNKTLERHEENYNNLSPQERTGPEIRRPDWMKEQTPKGAVTQKDLFDINYLSPDQKVYEELRQAGVIIAGQARRPLTMVMDGIERPLYIASTKDTRTSATGNAVYQWYYYDDFGVQQWLPDVVNPLAVAQVSVEPLNQFLPNVFNELEDKDFAEISERYAGSEFRSKNPNYWLYGTSFEGGLSAIVPGIELNRYISENENKIKERLKSSRNPKMPDITLPPPDNAAEQIEKAAKENFVELKDVDENG